MIPNFTIFGKTFSAYMICTLIGIFVAGIFSLKRVKKEDELEYLTILLWSSIGVLAGGSLLFGITNIGYLAKMFSGEIEFTLQNLGAVFGGSVFYGGLLGGLAVGYIYCRIKKIRFMKYADPTAMFIPLFHVFGRSGCFLSGCCFGCESSVGFVYKYSIIEMANNVRRFPVQLAEAFGNLVIFCVIFRLFRKGLFKERLLYLYFISYSVMRFTLEFFRGDSYRGFLFGLSTSQIISVVLFIVGIIWFLRGGKKMEKLQT